MRAFIVKHWILVKSAYFFYHQGKCSDCYSCTCIANKYLWKIEFVWNVPKQVMLKVISFSIGVHSKQAWACWCQSHRFLISETETSQMNTFAVLHAFIVNVKLSAGRIDLKWETLYLLASRLISWNNLNLLLPMELMFYFCEYVISLWRLWKSEILWLTS